ncbi:MAG: transporter substrate-binding domain-containing protein [Ferrovibrio sp.]
MLRSLSIVIGLTLAIVSLLPAPVAHSADLPELHYVAGRFPPYTQVNAGGTPVGPTAALIEALGKRIGRPAPLSVVPFARAITAAEHEPNTLIALIAPNAEREAKFHWLCPVLDYDVAVFRHRDHPEIVAHQVSELEKWRVGGVNRDVKTEYLQRHGIPVQIAADEDEATRLLLYGRIDALPAHPATLRMRLKEMGERSDILVPMLRLRDISSRLYLAFGLQTEPYVVEAVRKACYEMIVNGEAAQLMQTAVQN